MLNLIFADILSIMVHLVNSESFDIIGEDVGVTITIAALITNIPIFMIYFSRFLSRKTNRILNMIASILTIIYVVGGGSWLPHYLVIVTIEVVALSYIFWYALKWK